MTKDKSTEFHIGESIVKSSGYEKVLLILVGLNWKKYITYHT